MKGFPLARRVIQIHLTVPAKQWRVAATLLAIFTVCGCGYQQSGPAAQAGDRGYQWRSIYRRDINTVAVPIFTNKTYRRGIEFSLTKAIVNQLEVLSPYKVVSREKADTILEGEIASVNLRTLSNNRDTGVPQEQLYVINVNFTWKDQRTGRILTERRGFEQTSPFYPTLGEGQFVGSQQNVERLAVAIVQELQADW